MYPVRNFWGKQLYCFDADHERRRGACEHYACAHLWEVKKEGRRQSDLRCDRNRTLSGADGSVNNPVGCRLPCPVELGGFHVPLRQVQTGR